MKINLSDIKNLNINISNCIISCFSRSLDKHHLSPAGGKKNRIHLISSVVYIENFKFSERQIRIYNGENHVYYVFIIKQNFEFDNNKYVHISDDVNDAVYIFIDFEYFITLFQEDSLIMLNKIFGKKNMIEKDYSLIYNNCLFMFSDICWSNIVLNFKLRGVDISGGSISKRHILNTVDFQLFKGLYFLLSFDEKEIRQGLFNNYKNSFLTSYIPLDLYKKSVNLNLKLKDLNNIDYINLVNNLKLETNNETLNYISMDGYTTDFKKVIINNFLFTMELIQKNIINNFNLKISNLEGEIINITSLIKTAKSFIEEKEDLIKYGSKVSSVKQKKLLKKERTYFSNNEGLKEIALKKIDLEKLSIKNKNLESEKLLVKNELDEFNKICLNLNIEELNKILASGQVNEVVNRI